MAVHQCQPGMHSHEDYEGGRCHDDTQVHAGGRTDRVGEAQPGAQKPKSKLPPQLQNLSDRLAGLTNGQILVDRKGQNGYKLTASLSKEEFYSLYKDGYITRDRADKTWVISGQGQRLILNGGNKPGQAVEAPKTPEAPKAPEAPVVPSVEEPKAPKPAPAPPAAPKEPYPPEKPSDSPPNYEDHARAIRRFGWVKKGNLVLPYALDTTHEAQKDNQKALALLSREGYIDFGGKDGFQLTPMGAKALALMGITPTDAPPEQKHDPTPPPGEHLPNPFDKYHVKDEPKDAPRTEKCAPGYHSHPDFENGRCHPEGQVHRGGSTTKVLPDNEPDPILGMYKDKVKLHKWANGRVTIDGPMVNTNEVKKYLRDLGFVDGIGESSYRITEKGVEELKKAGWADDFDQLPALKAPPTEGGYVLKGDTAEQKVYGMFEDHPEAFAHFDDDGKDVYGLVTSWTNVAYKDGTFANTTEAKAAIGSFIWDNYGKNSHSHYKLLDGKSVLVFKKDMVKKLVAEHPELAKRPASKLDTELPFGTVAEKVTLNGKELTAPPKDKKAVAQWLEDNKIVHANFDNPLFSDELAHTFGMCVAENMAIIPQMSKTCHYIGMINDIKGIVGSRSSNGEWAYWTKNGVGTGAIGINEHQLKDKARLKAAMVESEAKKFHPVGCGTAKALLDHECGHAIQEALLLGDSDFQHIHSEWKRQDRKARIDSVSEYALKNSSEFFAECWSEFRNNPNPRPYAKRIGELVMRKSKEAKQ